MGLDQYAYVVAKNEQNTDLDHVAEDSVTIGVWRKNYELQDHMEKLYRKKGGTSEDFNLVSVRLSEDDLAEIGAEANSYNTSMFVRLAYMAINDGKEVYYNSWW